LQANGFAVSNTSVACEPANAPNATALAVLGKLLRDGQCQTCMFADDFHPATRLHELIAQFVEQQVAKCGLSLTPSCRQSKKFTSSAFSCGKKIYDLIVMKGKLLFLLAKKFIT